jgi:Fe-S-cluster containining protein
MKRSLPVIADCTGCGACCTGQAALPVSWYTAPDPFGDPATLPPALLAELEAMRDRMLAGRSFPKDGTPCVWYDAEARRCRHYEYRPSICRTEVNPGDEACRSWRRSLGIDPQPTYTLSKGRLVRK